MNGYIPQFVKEEYPLKSIDHLSRFLCQGARDPIFPLNVGQENYHYLSKNMVCKIYDLSNGT